MGTGHGPYYLTGERRLKSKSGVTWGPQMTNFPHLTDVSYAMGLTSVLWLASQNSECVLLYHARKYILLFPLVLFGGMKMFSISADKSCISLCIRCLHQETRRWFLINKNREDMWIYLLLIITDSRRLLGLSYLLRLYHLRPYEVLPFFHKDKLMFYIPIVYKLQITNENVLEGRNNSKIHITFKVSHFRWF